MVIIVWYPDIVHLCGTHPFRSGSLFLETGRSPGSHVWLLTAPEYHIPEDICKELAPRVGFTIALLVAFY